MKQRLINSWSRGAAEQSLTNMFLLTDVQLVSNLNALFTI